MVSDGPDGPDEDSRTLKLTFSHSCHELYRDGGEGIFVIVGSEQPG